MIAQPYSEDVVPRRPAPPSWPESINASITSQEWLAAFLLGLGGRLSVRFIGYFKMSEIACLLLLPFLMPALSRNRVVERLGPIMPLLGLALIGTVVSDVVRFSEFTLALRGIARVVTLLACVPVMTLFLQKGLYHKTVAMTWGSVPGIYISAYAFRSGAIEGRELVTGSASINWETHWSGLAMTLITLAGLILYKRSHFLGYASTFIGSAVQLVNGSRSAAGPGVVGIMLSLAIDLFGHPVSRAERRRSYFRAVVIAGACGLAIAVAFAAYESLASSGALGEQALKKYLKQSSSEYGVISGGRLDFFCGLLAVANSPFIGHGSWAVDTNEYYRRTCEWVKVEFNPEFYTKGYPLIPSHSALLNSWVETGVLGSLIWFYLLYLCVRALFMKCLDDKRMRLAVLTGAISGIFNILFSPVYSRIGYAVFIATFVNLLPIKQRAWNLVAARQPPHGRTRLLPQDSLDSLRPAS